MPRWGVPLITFLLSPGAKMGCFTFIKVMMILFNLAIFVSAPQLMSLPGGGGGSLAAPLVAPENWAEGLGSVGAASGEHPEPGMGWVKHAGVGSPAPPPPPHVPFCGGWSGGCGQLGVGGTYASGTPLGSEI